MAYLRLRRTIDKPPSCLSPLAPCGSAGHLPRRRPLLVSLVATVGVLLLLAGCGSGAAPPEGGDPPSGVIEGHLVAPDGSAMAASQISVALASAVAPAGASSAKLAPQAAGVTTTDARGRFATDVDVEGTYGLTFRDTARGIGSYLRVEVVRDASGALHAPPSTMQAAELGAVVGEVADRGSGVLVYLAGTSFLALTDAEGAFAITGVPAGSYRVSASLADATGPAREVTVVAGDSTTLSQPLALGPIVASVSPSGFWTPERELSGGRLAPFEVRIEGSGFGARQGVSTLRYAGVEVPSTLITSWTDQAIVVDGFALFESWRNYPIEGIFPTDTFRFSISTVAGNADAEASGPVWTNAGVINGAGASTEVATLEAYTQIASSLNSVKVGGVDITLDVTNGAAVVPGTSDEVTVVTTPTSGTADGWSDTARFDVVTDGWLPMIVTFEATGPEFANVEPWSWVARGAYLELDAADITFGPFTYTGRVLSDGAAVMPDDGDFTAAIYAYESWSVRAEPALDRAPLTWTADGSFSIDLNVPEADYLYLSFAVEYRGVTVAERHFGR